MLILSFVHARCLCKSVREPTSTPHVCGLSLSCSSARSSRTPREAFSNTTSPSRKFFAQPSARRFGRLHKLCSTRPQLAPHPPASPPARALRSPHPRRRAPSLATRACSARTLRPKLQHLPRDDDPALRLGSHQRRHHRIQRLRVRVVSIIHDPRAVELDHLATLRRRPHLLQRSRSIRRAPCHCALPPQSQPARSEHCAAPSGADEHRGVRLPTTTVNSRAIQARLRLHSHARTSRPFASP